ncbi:MAG: ATP-binding protein [Spirochaetes bacterium]|nr:ATP-binding protein [Spirochaetota bacterium]
MPEIAIIDTIAYDSMKEQIQKEIAAFLITKNIKGDSFPIPEITFEKGITRISFPIPFLNETLLAHFITIIKSYIENVRIHSFGDGYYAFQSLGRNLFKSENILDNLKIEFFGLTTNFKAELTKKGNLFQDEINLAIALYKASYMVDSEDPETRLKKLGATVYRENGAIDWSYIAGYDEVKRQIRESIILPLKNPEMYDEIARLTRKTFESNRPRAILFEGSPGVGKTTVARIIAGDVRIPLVYVPIESIMSKWYGQSSQNLSNIFEAADEMGGAIIFLDEIDALAPSRDSNMFEATRRVLSVLLRKLDGLDAATTTITIGATNRIVDLDHALVSRFDQTIHFPLPNAQERAAIFANYAKHLSQTEREELATLSEGLSGRTIKDICEFAERRWARMLLVKNLPPSLPEFKYYKHSVKLWTEKALH